jgi:hypothetical protein
VSGLKDELAPLIEVAKPRVPTLPGFAQMLLGGVLGFGYGFALYSVDWTSLPGGWIRDVVFVLVYLMGFICLLYAYGAVIALLLPPFQLGRRGEKTAAQKWMRRLGSIGGAVGLAVLPFLLDRVFGS